MAASLTDSFSQMDSYAHCIFMLICIAGHFFLNCICNFFNVLFLYLNNGLL